MSVWGRLRGFTGTDACGNHGCVPLAFSRSLRALGAERSGGVVAGVVAAALLLAAWSAWLGLGRVALIETSQRARVEAVAAVVPVAASLEGRVQRAELSLGRRVAAGELLFELDSQALQLERGEAQAQRQGLEAEQAALAGEQAALVAAQLAFEAGGRTRRSEALASVDEAEIAAAVARSLAARSDDLQQLGVESSESAELLRARERGTTAATVIRKLQVARTRSEVTERIAMLRIELARAIRQQAEVERELEARVAALASLDHRIALHTVRAPIAGTLGGVTPLQAGAVLARGATVAVVIPDGALRVVGWFTPVSVGRIRPGLPVRLRLDGFPWAEFGSLRGEVEAIASEAEAGLVRVECSLQGDPGSRIPVEHGLVGVLEVEVEAVSPGALLLRSLGQVALP
jgi:multidrug resistance efflux pump